MTWDMSLWNYHKLALLSAIFIFILISPPIYPFLKNHTTSQYWVAFIIALIVWSFIFMMLHVYSSKNKFNRSSDDMD
jgi:hypothetical protein